ncbi:MAG: PilZ domain-containing protein [Armatimonadetes bacterium]|nr:PilZ domain-containing protein [Armatimonadota bacterium]
MTCPPSDRSEFPGCENRRIAPRLNRSFPVGYGRATRTSAINVSATGIRILTQAPLDPTQPLTLLLEIEPETTVTVRGRPVWQQEVARDGAHVVGIHFDPGQAGEQARIAHWIERQQAA